MDAHRQGGRIGRYELGRLLGEGGQGQVWEAARAGDPTSRRVALKILDDPARLTQEARLGALLRHPHLVDVYEVGEEGGVGFLAMELCRGGTLARRALSGRAVVEVGLQVCAALQYANEELGLVHLDLKPGNLLLDGATVKVADLGIARARGFAPADRIEATPAYAAPELLRGEPVDARTDIYALGIVLHELLTGRRPERGEASEAAEPLTAATVVLGDGEPEREPGSTTARTVAIDDDTFGEPTTAEVLVQTGWDALLAGCLASRPADRFDTMADLARALRMLTVEGPPLAETLGVVDDRGGLPAAPAAGLVGREEELRRLAAELSRGVVVALRGPPGVGKTALAAEAAREWRARTAAPVWSCDLGRARAPDDLGAAVASALDLATADADPARVGHALRARGDGLLLLDGVERLAGAVDQAVAWSRASPRTRFLLTSRSALGAPVELEVGVLGADAGAGLVRAVAATRGVELADEAPVRALVARLDGLPMALELAAGRLGVLPIEEVLERLSVSLLRSGRGEADRSATLSDALEWSWDLLDPELRAVLARLAVFRGGASRGAMRRVVALPEAELEARLRALAAQSLVQAGDRVRMLEPVREFVAERAPDPLAEDRHGSWCAALGEADGRGELENLVAACERAAARGDLAVAEPTLEGAVRVLLLRGPLALADSLVERVRPLASGRARFELVAGRLAARRGDLAQARVAFAAARASAGDAALQARAWVATAHAEGELGSPEAALEACAAAAALLPGDPEVRAAGCGHRAVAHDRAGRFPEALAEQETALALHRERGDRAAEARALLRLGTLHKRAGQLDRARASYEAALHPAREVADRSTEAQALDRRGTLELETGRPREARALLRASLALHRECGDLRAATLVCANLGVLHHQLGDLRAALQWYEVGLRSAFETGVRKDEGLIRNNLGVLYSEQGRTEDAAACLELAVGIHRATGARVFEGDALASLAGVHLARGRPDLARDHLEEALAIFRAAGRVPKQAIALANLGRLDFDEGRFARAREAFETAIELHRRLGNRRYEGIVAGHLGLALAHLGDGDAARAALTEARARLAEVDDLHGLCLAWCETAEALALLGDADGARGAAREARARLAGLELPPTSELARRIAALPTSP